jgi:hypothetical protein
MIKINLLPPYVFERQIVQRLMMAFAALLVIIVIAGALARSQLSSKLADLEQQLATTKITEAQVVSNQSQASAERAKIGPITQKVTFIQSVLDHNLEGPALYEQLTRFTYEKVRYRSITLSDTTMEIDAYAPSLSDAGRYLLNLYRATDLFSSVTMSAVPGYSADSGGGQQIVSQIKVARGGATMAIPRAPVRGFDFKVTCVLAHPLSIPAYGGATSAATGSTGSAAPGVPPAAAAPAPPGAPGPGAPGGTPTGPIRGT